MFLASGSGIALNKTVWQVAAQLGKQLPGDIFKHNIPPHPQGGTQHFLQAWQSRT
jgi:hypothetical protein